MKTYFLPEERFHPFLLKLTEGNELLVQDGGHMHRFGLEDKATPAFGNIRAIEPMKHFFFLAKENIAVFGEMIEKDISPRVIIGARQCDIRALEIYDKVFLEGEFIDPSYKELREKTTIISVDCDNPSETCFCNLCGLNPWVESGTDLNITKINKGYIVEIISKKGELILEKSIDWFQTPAEEEMSQRNKIRENAVSGLKNQNPEPAEKKELLEVEKMDTKEWFEEATTCVECCACLMICPTCYCYLLYDKPNKERFRIWDTCFYPAYARIGGGANPRPDVVSRFKNRFACKFEYSAKNLKLFSCTGCGRCINGCTAKIDIRKIFTRLADKQ